MLFKSAYLGDSEVVKAYKGDTLFYEKYPYVKDNLKIWLDAISSRLVDGVWSDVLGNTMTKLDGSITRASDGSVYFNNGRLQSNAVSYFNQPFTIETVVKIVNLDNGQNIVGWTIDGATNGRGNIGKENSVIKFGNHTSSGWDNVYSSYAGTDGEYHTLTGVRDTSATKFYIDGILVASSSGKTKYNTPNKYLQVGFYSKLVPTTSKLNFLAVRLYSKALSEIEITQNRKADKAKFNI